MTCHQEEYMMTLSWRHVSQGKTDPIATKCGWKNRRPIHNNNSITTCHCRKQSVASNKFWIISRTRRGLSIFGRGSPTKFFFLRHSQHVMRRAIVCWLSTVVHSSRQRADVCTKDKARRLCSVTLGPMLWTRRMVCMLFLATLCRLLVFVVQH